MDYSSFSYFIHAHGCHCPLSEHFLYVSLLLRADLHVRYSEFGGCPLFGCCYRIIYMETSVGAYTSVRYSVDVRYWECPLIESPLYSTTSASHDVSDQAFPVSKCSPPQFIHVNVNRVRGRTGNEATFYVHAWPPEQPGMTSRVISLKFFALRATGLLAFSRHNF